MIQINFQYKIYLNQKKKKKKRYKTNIFDKKNLNAKKSSKIMNSERNRNL